MNETNGENERIERILGQARLPEPSNELRDQVTTAAREAWGQTPTDIPWQVPLRRLVLSAAAAVIIVALANHFSDSGIREDNPRCHATTPTEVFLPEASVSPLMKRRVYLGRQPAEADASTLRRYVEDIEKILDEMEDNGTIERPTPRGGGSRLLPSDPTLETYS